MNTYLIGDCVEKIREIPDNSIHCIITAAAWGDAWSYSRYPDIIKATKGGCSGTWDFPVLVHEMYRVLVPGGMVCWHVGDNCPPYYETLVHARQAVYFVDEVGFTLHKTIICQRDVGDFQYTLCFSKGIPRVYTKIHDIDIWSGPSRFQEEISRFFNEGIETPNITPNGSTAIWLTHDLILTYTQEGDTILDPFCGSGTTLQESEKLNRIGIGIEIDPGFWKYL